METKIHSQVVSIKVAKNSHASTEFNANIFESTISKLNKAISVLVSSPKIYDVIDYNYQWYKMLKAIEIDISDIELMIKKIWLEAFGLFQSRTFRLCGWVVDLKRYPNNGTIYPEPFLERLLSKIEEKKKSPKENMGFII
ncbi:MAG: hypothetical protein MHPSP_004466, partial [Paramarteilia canceri]